MAPDEEKNDPPIAEGDPSITDSIPHLTSELDRYEITILKESSEDVRRLAGRVARTGGTILSAVSVSGAVVGGAAILLSAIALEWLFIPAALLVLGLGLAHLLKKPKPQIARLIRREEGGGEVVHIADGQLHPPSAPEPPPQPAPPKKSD